MQESRRPASHLINILAATRSQHPNFTLFIGAGCSVESGVKTATSMIDEWREQHFKLYGGCKDRADHFKDLAWYKEGEEYSCLFEALYDQPSLRREYIESCLENAIPSWGYIYLVHLIERGVFNTIFTTNFDDLLNESCYLFSSNVRPIVCAHDSSIRSLRITSKRPKIIKLHGDFLFDSIKNTLRELETLESNMRDKFRQYAGEFGMIFVGYAGNDRSIMDTLTALMRSEQNFPHGIYWCVRSGDQISPQVELLTRFPQFRLVEISGFDTFFAKLNAGLNTGQAPFFGAPYQAVQTRLNELINKMPPRAKDPDPESMDLHKAIESLRIQLGTSQPTVSNAPYQWLASTALKDGENEKARGFALSSLSSFNDENEFQDRVKLVSDVLSAEWDDELANQLKAAAEVNRKYILSEPAIMFEPFLACMKWKKFDRAREFLRFSENGHWKTQTLEEYYLINRAQVELHAGNTVPAAYLPALETIAKWSNDPLSRFGAHLVLKREGLAFLEMESYLKEGGSFDNYSIDYRSWPIFDLLSAQVKSTLFGLIEQKNSERLARMDKAKRSRQLVRIQVDDGSEIKIPFNVLKSAIEHLEKTSAPTNSPESPPSNQPTADRSNQTDRNSDSDSDGQHSLLEEELNPPLKTEEPGNTNSSRVRRPPKKST